MGQGIHLQRSIGLAGATAIVVGGVIGAGIYVMVAPIVANAGPTLWLAFLTAMLVSFFGVIPLVQLAGAIPGAGAGFLYTSRLLSPRLGFLTSAWVILGGGASTSVVAITLAQYVQPLLPVALSTHTVAIGVVLAFYLLLQFGMQLAISFQVVLAIQFVIALCVYGLVGAFHTTDLNLGLTPPQGWGGFGVAVLLSYATCLGFQVIAELGEEIKNAKRNIPLALIIGGAIVTFIYILVGTVFISTVNTDAEYLNNLQQPLSTSAKAFLSPFWIHFLGLGAIGAGLTSLNAAAISLPREFYAVSRDGLLPPSLSRVSPRTHAPQRAVTIYFGFVVLLLLTHQSEDLYGMMAAVGILTMTVVIAFASLNLEQRFPEEYAKAYIQFPRPVLIGCLSIATLASVGFCAVVLYEVPQVAGVYLVWTVLVLFAYRYYGGQMSEEGFARLRELPEQER